MSGGGRDAVDIGGAKIPGLLGWWLPVGARKWHAADEQRRSLCGLYAAMGVASFEEITAEASPTTPDDCRACARKVEAAWNAFDAVRGGA